MFDLPTLEQLADQAATGPVVVGYENTLALQTGPVFGGFARTGVVQFQCEPEGRSFSGLTVDPDFTAHHFHQLLADGKPEPGAAVAPGGRVVGLAETFEQGLLILRPEADAGIDDAEANP